MKFKYKQIYQIVLMITRIWLGITLTKKAEAYERYMRDTSLKACNYLKVSSGVLIMQW